MPELVDSLRDYEQVTRVLRAFEMGGRIVNMSVTTFPPPLTPEEIAAGTLPTASVTGSIDTRDMDYPPQMIETIKTNLKARQKQLADELAGMGVIVPTEIKETT